MPKMEMRWKMKSFSIQNRRYLEAKRNLFHLYKKWFSKCKNINLDLFAEQGMLRSLMIYIVQ